MVTAGGDQRRKAAALTPRGFVPKLWLSGTRAVRKGRNRTMSQYFVGKSDCTRRTIFPGVDAYTACGAEVMLSFVEFAPGAVVEAHSHPHEQVGIVLEGQARFIVGDEERVLGPGDMYRIPGNVEHRVVALDAGLKALDVFHPIREDYR